MASDRSESLAIDSGFGPLFEVSVCVAELPPIIKGGCGLGSGSLTAHDYVKSVGGMSWAGNVLGGGGCACSCSLSCWASC